MASWFVSPRPVPSEKETKREDSRDKVVIENRNEEKPTS